MKFNGFFFAGDDFIPGVSSCHAWNAVFLNGTWRLLDCTWAAGKVRRREIPSKSLHLIFMLPYGILHLKACILERWGYKSCFDSRSLRTDTPRSWTSISSSPIRTSSSTLTFPTMRWIITDRPKRWVIINNVIHFRSRPITAVGSCSSSPCLSPPSIRCPCSRQCSLSTRSDLYHGVITLRFPICLIK